MIGKKTVTESHDSLGDYQVRAIPQKRDNRGAFTIQNDLPKHPEVTISIRNRNLLQACPSKDRATHTAKSRRKTKP
jgi:hypothetical protein